MGAAPALLGSPLLLEGHSPGATGPGHALRTCARAAIPPQMFRLPARITAASLPAQRRQPLSAARPLARGCRCATRRVDRNSLPRWRTPTTRCSWSHATARRCCGVGPLPSSWSTSSLRATRSRPAPPCCPPAGPAVGPAVNLCRPRPLEHAACPVVCARAARALRRSLLQRTAGCHPATPTECAPVAPPCRQLQRWRPGAPRCSSGCESVTPSWRGRRAACRCGIGLPTRPPPCLRLFTSPLPNRHARPKLLPPHL